MMQAVRFAITAHAAWAPGISSQADWQTWAQQPYPLIGEGEPPVRQMAPMLRRRAGFLGKMALEVAYQCLPQQTDVPTVFCSRHGEAARAVELLTGMAKGELMSPTSFALAVHNASAGLFSIARQDHANHAALAAGNTSVEHAVLEACGLLADGAEQVLLVVYDNHLPPQFTEFEDCAEQAHAFAWLLQSEHRAGRDGAQVLQLQWQAADGSVDPAEKTQMAMPGSLQVLQFFIGGATALVRVVEQQRWSWTRHV